MAANVTTSQKWKNFCQKSREKRKKKKAEFATFRLCDSTGNLKVVGFKKNF